MANEGQEENKSDLIDIDTQISIKQALIIDVMGKKEGNELLDKIKKDPKIYTNDSRKMVKELSALLVRKGVKEMNMADLYLLVQDLQSKIKELQSNKREWQHVGLLNDIEQLVKQYSPLKYEYGVRYNHTLGCVHELIFNSWNRGIRISTKYSYPMGDNAKQLQYGRTVFTKGLDDADDKNQWYQHYIYEHESKYYSSNGAVNSAIFVRPM